MSSDKDASANRSVCDAMLPERSRAWLQAGGEECTGCLRGACLLHQLLYRASQLIPGLGCLRKQDPFKLMPKQRWAYITRWSCIATELGTDSHPGLAMQQAIL